MAVIDSAGRTGYHIGMNAVRSFGRRSVGVCVAFILLHLLFSVRSALPGLVFCHRTDGRIVMEFEGLDAQCSCTDCEHCLESRAGVGPTTGARTPSLHACHCQHELFFSEIGRSFVRLPDRILSFAPCAAPQEIIPLLLSGLTGMSAPSSWFLSGSGPSGYGRILLLRC